VTTDTIIPAGTRMRCPRCGHVYVTTIDINAAWCTGNVRKHTRTHMEEHTDE
jgi:hypothetical protein